MERELNTPNSAQTEASSIAIIGDVAERVEGSKDGIGSRVERGLSVST
jgi:hypothetical protein